METSAFAFAVTRDGENIAANMDGLVPWWSITKSVLAAAVLRLADQGRLRLDAAFRDRPFTVRQLLQHRAGVANYGGKPYRDAVARGDPAWTVDELLARVDAGTPLFDPGKGWAYSNVGYIFVRQLIEETVGAGLGPALKSIVFDPLGMRSVRVAATPGDLDRTLWGNAGAYDPNWVYHGLLIGSPADAVRFLHKLPSPPFLSERAFASMVAGHPVGGAMPGRPWRETGYGLGLMTGVMAGAGRVHGHSGAGRVHGHSGAGPGSVSALYRFPDLDPPATAASFAQADDEGRAEYEAVRIATAPDAG